MHPDKIIEIFCESKGILKESLLGTDKYENVRYARYMLYLILRDKCGISSYKLAVMFNRTRRNIVRGISMVRHHIKLYAEIRNDYHTILKKIEDAAETTSSED